jgi:prephenate dehydrogenase
VIGVDRPAVLRAARRRGVIAHGSASIESAARRADIVVLAAPPVANRRLLARLARIERNDLVVTDTGSVKTGIVREAERLGLTRFVGGHPMAGSERSGFGAASRGLFMGRPWLLTPTRTTDAAALRRVTSLVRALGARPFKTTPTAHDRSLAFISHVPQIVAWALYDAAQGDAVARHHLAAAGPGFRDMTRLARSPRALWREILGENQREIRRALAGLRAALSRNASRP